MSTLSHDDYTLLLSLPSASRTNPSKQSSLPDTIFGNNREQSPKPESDHEFKFSQSQRATPTPAVLASLESVPAKMSTQFNSGGRPIAGTPMASISSYLKAHQQMHLPGVLMQLTNGRFQFKVVPLHGMTSKNTYMYPSESNHKKWFIFYMLDKRASSAEAARKLTKGDHNIMSNGKVLYSKFKISKNSELAATTRNHIMEVHGPNPKGTTTSCYYMIVEFEEPMSPKLITYDAGLGMILPKMYDIVNHKANYDDDTGELVFNLQTEARYNTTLNNSEEDTDEEEHAGNRWVFLVLHSFHHFPLAISQPVILMYATEEMVFACPQPPIMKDSFMDSMRTVLMTTVPTHTTGTGGTVPKHPAGHQATLIAWMKEHQGLRPISTDTI
jgi:hypothetical protein